MIIIITIIIIIRTTTICLVKWPEGADVGVRHGVKHVNLNKLLLYAFMKLEWSSRSGVVCPSVCLSTCDTNLSLNK